MMVLLLPPRAFCRSLVSTESLYGTITFFLPMDRSANACDGNIQSVYRRGEGFRRAGQSGVGVGISTGPNSTRHGRKKAMVTESCIHTGVYLHKTVSCPHRAVSPQAFTCILLIWRCIRTGLYMVLFT